MKFDSLTLSYFLCYILCDKFIYSSDFIAVKAVMRRKKNFEVFLGKHFAFSLDKKQKNFNGEWLFPDFVKQEKREQNAHHKPVVSGSG